MTRSTSISTGLLLTGLLTLTLTTAPSVIAQSQAQTKPQGASTGTALPRWDELEFPTLKNFSKPDVEIYTLDNGIRFYLVEDRELPLITLRTLVKTGDVLAADSKVGLGELTGEVMRSGGSKSHPADELNRLLENKAAFIESSIGFTSGNVTMNLLKEDLKELLPVYVDLLQNPAFPEDKLDLAKTQYKSGISRRNDDQSGIANREFDRLIYGPQSVYGRMMEYETVDAITREDLVDFHGDAFVGSNMMIGVIGDFDAKEMKRELRRAFGSIKKGNPTNLLLPDVTYEFPSTVNLIDKPDVNQSYILLGHIGGRRSNPDYAKLQVMNEVLSGGFSGRLFQVVRTDLGLAYAVFGSYGSNALYPGQFYAGVMTQSATTAEAIEAIMAQIRRMQEEPISQEELQRTKDQFLNSLVFQYDSKQKVLNERMGNDYVGLPKDSFDKLIDEIKAVTIDDVQRVAKAYLRPDALQILVVGNAAEIGDQLERFGTVNTIDITIPVPGVGGETASGDPEKGAQWLARMAAALLPDGPVEGAVQMEGVQKVDSPMGPLDLNTSSLVNYKTLEIRNEITAPFGVITISIVDGKGSQSMAGQSMPMQSAEVGGVLAELRREPLYLAFNAAQIQAEYLGEGEVDGIRTARLLIVGDTSFEVQLNAETGLPMESSASSFSPQKGAQVNTRTVYSDWTLKAGVRAAYSTVTYADGEKASEFKASSHQVK